MDLWPHFSTNPYPGHPSLNPSFSRTLLFFFRLFILHCHIGFFRRLIQQSLHQLIITIPPLDSSRRSIQLFNSNQLKCSIPRIAHPFNTTQCHHMTSTISLFDIISNRKATTHKADRDWTRYFVKRMTERPVAGRHWPLTADPVTQSHF